MMGRDAFRIGTWHGYACVECTRPHVRVGPCEVAFVIRCSHTYGDMCRYVRQCGGITHMRVDDARWHDTSTLDWLLGLAHVVHVLLVVHYFFHLRCMMC